MSGRKQGKLIITLKSDLCAGSGYSYAGIVDSDTSYDECGLPYIPAKRLKGCIRESLETLLYGCYPSESVDRVFGKKGSSYGSAFKMDNAYIEDYDAIRDFLLADKDIEPQMILDRYTHITGQTRLENGVADTGSLRYTRLVNHYSPIDGKELIFTADFSCEDDDWDMIVAGAKATRHIGLKRNRGLGNVRITVCECSDEKDTKDYIKQTEDGGYTTLWFAVRNTQPLMMSRNMEDESVDYIPGQQVLGLMASRYLKDHSADEEAFKVLFLDGHSVFGNLYPYDGKNIYYPAPDYLNRLKKTKKIVYNISDTLPDISGIKDEDYRYDGGNQPKKLKGKFVAWTASNEISVHEVKKDVIYHHSHRNTHETGSGNNTKEEGILYSLEAIRKGQMFAGYIRVPSEYADITRELMLDGDMFFGKSRTAQYGRCRLVDYSIASQESTNSFAEGTDVVVTFLSDTVLNDNKGNPAVYYEDVRKAVADELGISGDDPASGYISSIQTTTATGYMSIWNLRKPAVPAIRAGSYITYHLSDELTGYKELIGERTLEGYGRIRLDNVSSCEYDSINEKPNNGHIGDKAIDETVRSRISQLIIPIIYDQWLDRKINEVIIGTTSLNVKNSSAGRILLMLRESIDETDNEENAFNEFGKRIDSFKTGSTKEEGRKILKRIGSIEDSFWKLSADSEFAGADDILLKMLSNAGIKDDPKERTKRWPRYVMAILTDRKYKGRENDD